MSHEHENLIISLMEARKEGKTIQCKNIQGEWKGLDSTDYKFFTDMEYRIKPEPRELLLAKWKSKDDRVCSYWSVSSGEEYPDKNYDYIRVREILED